MQSLNDPDNSVLIAGDTVQGYGDPYDLNELALVNNWGSALPTAPADPLVIAQQEQNLVYNPGHTQQYQFVTGQEHQSAVTTAQIFEQQPPTGTQGQFETRFVHYDPQHFRSATEQLDPPQTMSESLNNQSAGLSVYSYYTNETPRPMSTEAAQPDIITRKTSFIHKLRHDAKGCAEAVVNATDLFCCSMFDKPGRSWEKDKDKYETSIGEALSEVQRTIRQFSSHIPEKERTILEDGYDFTDEAFTDYLYNGLTKIRDHFKTCAEDLTEPIDKSEFERDKGFGIMANGPDGKRPSNKLIRERVKGWLRNHTFAHDGTLDSNGRVIDNFLQELAFEIVYRVCYEGLGDHDETQRSFVQGLKQYCDRYQIPTDNIPFLGYIPSEAIIMALAALKRTLDNRSHGDEKKCVWQRKTYLVQMNRIRNLMNKKGQDDLEWKEEYTALLKDRAAKYLLGIEEF